MLYSIIAFSLTLQIWPHRRKNEGKQGKPSVLLVEDGLAVGQSSHTHIVQQLRHICEAVVQVCLQQHIEG